MARHLTEKQIAEYRECFNLHDKKQNGRIVCRDLVTVMRSLGTCPTEAEIQTHLKSLSKSPNDHMDFSQFLDIMHKQGPTENVGLEILEAFKMTDESKTGTIPLQYLKHILMKTGDVMTQKEVDQMLQKAKINKTQKTVNYKDLISQVSYPIPDY